MPQNENFQTSQGEDLTIELIYKVGDTSETAVATDLLTGGDYEARMDITAPNSSLRLFTLNSAPLADADPILDGDQPDSAVEITLGTGVDGTPNVSAKVPRALTLPGGALYDYLNADSRITAFGYDMFLRHIPEDNQVKILQGVILYEGSKTLWP